MNIINQERFIDRGIPTGLDGKPVESLKDIVFADPSENFSNHEANFFELSIEHEIADRESHFRIVTKTNCTPR